MEVEMHRSSEVGDDRLACALPDAFEARSAFADAYGNEVVEVGTGGTIPFIAEFARAYPGATVLVTGVGDPASRWHGIDKSLHLDMWQTACVAEALLLQRLASMGDGAGSDVS